MIHLTITSGQLEIKESAFLSELLYNLLKDQHHIENEVRARAQAEAVLLAVVYRIAGEPDPVVPFGGLLTSRLQLSERSIREAIADGRLGYFLAAKKAYRVPEPAVRRFVAGLPPLVA